MAHNPGALARVAWVRLLISTVRTQTNHKIRVVMLGRLILLCSLLTLAGQAAALTIYKYTDANGVVTYTDQAAPGAQVFVFRDRMVERLDNQVKLETKKHEAGETLLVRNDLYAPVQVELRLEQLANIVGAPGKPISWVLPPRSKIQIG